MSKESKFHSRQYLKRKLERKDLDDDPFSQFDVWYGEVLRTHHGSSGALSRNQIKSGCRFYELRVKPAYSPATIGRRNISETIVKSVFSSLPELKAYRTHYVSFPEVGALYALSLPFRAKLLVFPLKQRPAFKDFTLPRNARSYAALARS